LRVPVRTIGLGARRQAQHKRDDVTGRVLEEAKARGGRDPRHAGAILTMLADTMMPEAYENGRRFLGFVWSNRKPTS
jgi:hypothetical protein